ncbi:MAG TPA: hypothetical protein VIM10_16935 [Actinopolymorphaceae bacterium]|jgi:hypothetical protein
MTDADGSFTPARLSPAPVDHRPCALPYGVTWDDLRHCLPGFTTAAGARAWIAHDKQGLNGGVTSCILTIGYPTPDGDERTQTVFVKQAVDPTRAEAARYRFLESRGIPVPRLLASVDTAHGEVIVVEFLPTIGVGSHDADELLGLVALLNAVAHPPAELFKASAGMPVEIFDAKVLAALALLADDPASGDVVDRERWFGAYKSIEDAVGSMPAALNHGELAFQQVGRTGSGRVVLFDLETMAVLPRFTDVAAVLGGLAQLTGRDQRDLFGGYLREYVALTGTALQEESAWTELLSVRVVSSLQALPWLMETIDDPDVGFDPRTFARALGADLRELEPDLDK